MDFNKIFSLKKYVVLQLTYDTFKPFTKFRGPVSFSQITGENYASVAQTFPPGKVAVFKQKLKRGDVGVFAYYKKDVAGYMWRRDYDTAKKIKVDGYIPLSGKFSHFHFARVDQKMRGRALQLGMFAWLIDNAYAKGQNIFYTDMDIENIASIRGPLKIGFKALYNLAVVRLGNRAVFFKKYNKIARSTENC